MITALREKELFSEELISETYFLRFYDGDWSVPQFSGFKILAWRECHTPFYPGQCAAKKSIEKALGDTPGPREPES
jgi:hypothetical protein